MTSVMTLEPNFGCGGVDPVPAKVATAVGIRSRAFGGPHYLGFSSLALGYRLMLHLLSPTKPLSQI